MCWAGWSRSLAFYLTLVLPGGPLGAAEPIDDSFLLGAWHQRIFGSDYRQLWHTPIAVRELDLLNTAGGLTPVREVGQRQTPGLAFKGANGKAYTFRSARKDPVRALPEHLQDTPVAIVVADQASADFPAASLVAGPLGQSAGLLTPAPRLVRLPDSPLLGEFRARFAGRLGTFERYPTVAGLQADEIIGGWDIFDRLQQGAHEQINARLYLRARLMDLSLGDWDRHADRCYSNYN